MLTPHNFITNQEAIRIVKQEYPIAPVTEQAYFALLKYDRAQNQFTASKADPDTKSITDEAVMINFKGGKYLSDKKVDRFVWIILGETISLPRYIVDAENGEIVGYYSPCPSCG